jgi:hypothetical protein
VRLETQITSSRGSQSAQGAFLRAIAIALEVPTSVTVIRVQGDDEETVGNLIMRPNLGKRAESSLPGISASYEDIGIIA